MTQEKIDIIRQCAEELLSDLGIEATVVAQDLETKDGVLLDVQSPDNNLLIGYHAEVLGAIQLFVGLMTEKRLGEWVKVVVNVGNYRQQREEQLRDLAMSLAQKAKFSGEVQIANNLTASERRIVHLVLADHPDVVTESEGEGRERRLLIKPKVSGDVG